MKRILIVTPDLSSGGIARRILKQERRAEAKVFACSEDFTSGPLILEGSPEQLLRIRHRFWSRLHRPELDWPHPFERLRGQVPLRRALMEADHVEVLLGGRGSEQLFLLGLAQLVKDLGVEPDKIEVFQYPAAMPWAGLGMLNVDGMAARPQPIRFTDALMTRLVGLWSVVCDRAPEPLFRVHAEKMPVPELPYLHRALDDLVMSYPDVRTGLNVADCRLLSAVSTDWRVAMRAIGEAMIGDRRGRGFGDLILSARLLSIADPRQAQRAIEMRGEGPSLRNLETRITEFGLACLAGQENLVAANGVDCWIGGVHLSSGARSVWYRGDQGPVFVGSVQ
jgi:hypothetical protein